jgi:hypothetical protein
LDCFTASMQANSRVYFTALQLQLLFGHGLDSECYMKDLGISMRDCPLS